MTRAFLSLTPDAHSAVAIHQWSSLCWPAINKSVPVQNYHLTLAFLGDVDASQLSRIKALFAELNHSVVELTLNQVGYWPDTTTLWLGPEHTPESLLSLVASCKTIANRAGVRVDSRRYKPHLTLARKTSTPPAHPLIDPDFQIRFESLELYQSIMDRNGVRYVELESQVLV